jgi:hypothetical protein
MDSLSDTVLGTRLSSVLISSHISMKPLKIDHSEVMLDNDVPMQKKQVSESEANQLWAQSSYIVN